MKRTAEEEKEIEEAERQDKLLRSVSMQGKQSLSEGEQTRKLLAHLGTQIEEIKNTKAPIIVKKDDPQLLAALNKITKSMESLEKRIAAKPPRPVSFSLVRNGYGIIVDVVPKYE